MSILAGLHWNRRWRMKFVGIYSYLELELGLEDYGDTIILSLLTKKDRSSTRLGQSSIL